MAKNAGVRLSSGGRIICPKMISPQYVLQSPRHRRSQRREQRAGWPSLKQAVGTRVLHDQLGSTKEGRPKSAGEGSQLAHGRFGTSLPRIAIHHALISGLLIGHSSRSSTADAVFVLDDATFIVIDNRTQVFDVAMEYARTVGALVGGALFGFTVVAAIIVAATVFPF